VHAPYTRRVLRRRLRVDGISSDPIRKKQPADSQHSTGRTVVIGLAVAGPSLVQLKFSDPQMAQATPPLQPTATPTPQNSPPAESKPGGDRPTTPAPEPARPDVEVQKVLKYDCGGQSYADRQGQKAEVGEPRRVRDRTWHALRLERDLMMQGGRHQQRYGRYRQQPKALDQLDAERQLLERFLEDTLKQEPEQDLSAQNKQPRLVECGLELFFGFTFHGLSDAMRTSGPDPSPAAPF
jgi:hypothetical protein